jgi:hypothetical protein
MSEISRRRALLMIGTAGAATWVTPVITRAASASTPPGSLAICPDSCGPQTPPTLGITVSLMPNTGGRNYSTPIDVGDPGCFGECRVHGNPETFGLDIQVIASEYASLVTGANGTYGSAAEAPGQLVFLVDKCGEPTSITVQVTVSRDCRFGTPPKDQGPYQHTTCSQTTSVTYSGMTCQ